MLKGGSYEVRDGKRVLVQCTQDHPEGNRGARDKDGRLRNAPPDEPAPEQAKPAESGLFNARGSRSKPTAAEVKE